MNSNIIKQKLYYLMHPSFHKIEKQWREKNQRNFTKVNVISNNKNNISVGAGTYGEITAFNDRADKTLTIGNYCSIAPNVTFLVARDHRISTVSSFPFKQIYKLEKNDYYDAVSKGNIVVDDDVWIGYGATILSGVHIGQGAVIAAGAVVTHDIPPYAIAGGVPAKVIRMRFSDEVISFLLSLDYGKLSEELVRGHVEDLYLPLEDMSLEEIKQLFVWFPKK